MGKAEFDCMTEKLFETIFGEELQPIMNKKLLAGVWMWILSYKIFWSLVTIFALDEIVWESSRKI